MGLGTSPPDGFDDATSLPVDAAEQRRWQEANRNWWQQNPMRYDWSNAIPAKEFSEDFFSEVDRRFFSDAKQFMPWRILPFDSVIPFDQLGSKDVLEIGVGNGSHAELLARYARIFTGIDLTEYAVNATTARLKLRGLLPPARIQQMDAENLDFDDASFDFIWSWGVIHHSANTSLIVEEMHRILRAGGSACVMIYYRSWWHYYLRGTLLGMFNGDVARTRSVRRGVQLANQRRTDGALARFYSKRDWEDLVSPYFQVTSNFVCGSKNHAIPMPGGRLKDTAHRVVPDSLGRFLTNTCHMGSFLVSHMVRRDDVHSAFQSRNRSTTE